MGYKKIHASRIFTHSGWLDNGVITLEGEKIVGIEKSEETCPNNLIVMPALIDTHIHGVMGVDTMDATHDSLNTISRFLASRGVGAFLATTVTESHEKIEAALQQIKQSMSDGVDGATLLGAYLEGTFFNPIHKGAHPESLLHAPEKSLLEKWIQISEGTLKSIALAPEYPNAKSIINWLCSQNIRVMIGHTNADYQTVKEALLAGASGVVHCYNGMSGLHHRNPGVVGAAFSIPNCQTEIIVDGHHVHPAAVNIAFKCCGANLLLVSDAMRATGMQNGNYYLGQLLVEMKDNIVRTKEGGLAGSTLTLENAVSNLRDFADIPFEQAWLHGSYYPAKALGLDHYLGSLSVGKQANLTLLDAKHHIVSTIVNGKLVFDAKKINTSDYLF